MAIVTTTHDEATGKKVNAGDRKCAALPLATLLRVTQGLQQFFYVWFADVLRWRGVLDGGGSKDQPPSYFSPHESDHARASLTIDVNPEP